MKNFLLTLFSALLITQMGNARDGHELWLKGNAPIGHEPTAVAKAELQALWKGEQPKLTLDKNMKYLPEGSFTITLSQGKAPQIGSNSPAGLLYGSYHLLRMQALGQTAADTMLLEKPSYNIRILNHWDNLDGTIERGYAGHSIFWNNTTDQTAIWRDYARANASVGINAFVPDNVNASPQVLTEDYLQQVKQMADVVRPYGIRVYLAINFASPMVIDGLSTADPLNAKVQSWWQQKVKEIYALIPDFGGFLVKANSEGQPGPNDFGRTHAEGANMLARALKPYNGIVMWRAFVYSPSDPDRAKQAYLEFQPLDGKFLDNVIIQIKNGPIDFQPREPYSALFGAMPRTREMAEVQITQEYLGHSNHIAYLGTMWQEFLEEVRSHTDCLLNNKQCGTGALTAFSGVSNVGNSESWCGNVMAQSNWYAFGRLAWNDHLSAEEIAKEWSMQTFAEGKEGEEVKADREKALQPLVSMMMRSRETVVDYMMPLGLHHQFAWGHHYGPEPYCDIPGARPDWMPSYYHKADAEGLGFNRSSTGTNATGQYPRRYQNELDDPMTCPYQHLLFFHHIGWKQNINHQYGKKTRTESLWNALCHHYQHGLNEVRVMQQEWQKCQGQIDAEIYADIAARLRIQARDAQWWKDGCLLYFQTFSKMPFPEDVEMPVHSLEELIPIQLGITNFECPTPELLNKVR